MRGNIGAIVLILVGAFFLLSNLGLLNISLRELIATWWPLILILLGIGMFLSPGGRGRK
ncbi:DUF5668 domain-containing protein [Ottowia sp.]|uniref:LiaI-LiaF-like domain-containing protein n=1 Tax=Ottowia sp. TaxID=1898956 RepID=UPI0026120D70|nr:DUF5668 domain-containing protein [Ottowia sp.]